MNALPKPFEPCRYKVEIELLGTLGTITGYLFHYPCWIGILDPVPTFATWQEELLNRLEYEDIVIQLQDLGSGEVWLGMMSDLTPPAPDYPWHELKWHDNRPLPSASRRKIWQKLQNWLGRSQKGAS